MAKVGEVHDVGRLEARPNNVREPLARTQESGFSRDLTGLMAGFVVVSSFFKTNL